MTTRQKYRNLDRPEGAERIPFYRPATPTTGAVQVAEAAAAVSDRRKIVWQVN